MLLTQLNYCHIDNVIDVETGNIFLRYIDSLWSTISSTLFVISVILDV